MDIDEPLEVTKTLYSVLDFLEWQRSGALDLRPYFQRGSVWTPKAKSFFVDTLLRGYPVPIIFLQNRTDAHTLKNVRQVVDGQQRLRTILAYMDKDSLPDANPSDDIRIMRTHNRDLAGKSFDELPRRFRDRLATTELSVHVLPSKLADKDLLQLFARLNSTGERLNDQELRNAEFHGAFKSTAYELAYGQLDRWRDWTLFNPRALAQMREVELTSELMMLLLRGLSGKSKAAIDGIYKKYDDDFPQADLVVPRFQEVFDVLDAIFQPDSRGRGVGLLQTQSWLYALFAAVAGNKFGAPLGPEVEWEPSVTGRVSPQEWRRAAGRAASSLETGKVSEQLAKALRGASSDRASRQSRYDFIIGNLG